VQQQHATPHGEASCLAIMSETLLKVASTIIAEIKITAAIGTLFIVNHAVTVDTTIEKNSICFG